MATRKQIYTRLREAIKASVHGAAAHLVVESITRILEPGDEARLKKELDYATGTRRWASVPTGDQELILRGLAEWAGGETVVARTVATPAVATQASINTKAGARAMMEQLMTELGEKHLGYPLQSKGWTCGFGNTKRALGRCFLGRRRIELSSHYVKVGTPDIIEDTIRHEIAHAIDYVTRGTSNHDRVWKAWAVKCGAAPNRCKDLRGTGIDLGYKAERYCPNCKKVNKRLHVMPARKAQTACASCCNEHNSGRWHPDFVFKYRRIK